MAEINTPMRAHEIINQQYQEDQKLARECFVWFQKEYEGFKDIVEKYDLQAAAIKIISEFIKAARTTNPQIDPKSKKFMNSITGPFFNQIIRVINSKPRQQDFWDDDEGFVDQELDFNLEPEPEDPAAALARQKAEQEKQQAAKQLKKYQEARKEAVDILDSVKALLGDRYSSIIAKIQHELETAGVVPGHMTSEEAAENILITSSYTPWFVTAFGSRPDPRLALIAVKRVPYVITYLDPDLRTPTLWMAAVRVDPDNMAFVADISPDSLKQEIIDTLGLRKKWQEYQYWYSQKYNRGLT